MTEQADIKAQLDAARAARAEYDALQAEVDRLVQTTYTARPCPRGVLLQACRECGESFARMERADLDVGKVSETTMDARYFAFWEYMFAVVGLARCLPVGERDD